MPIVFNNNEIGFQIRDVHWHVPQGLQQQIQAAQPPVPAPPEPVPAANVAAENNFKFADFPEFHEELKHLKNNFPAARFTPVGSYETTKDEFVDVDVLMLCNHNPTRHLLQNNWNPTGEYDAGQSYKKQIDNVTANIIWVSDVKIYQNFQKAAMLCKHLNLMTKEDRILVHEVFINKVLKKNIWELDV